MNGYKTDLNSTRIISSFITNSNGRHSVRMNETKVLTSFYTENNIRIVHVI